MGRIIKEGLLAFTEKNLFAPLAINEYRWHVDGKGIPIGGFGLALKTKDLLKLGQVMLQEGQWGNKYIVTKNWVQESIQCRFKSYPNIGGYGYHWWVLLKEDGTPFDPYVYFAMGYGGQYILIIPSLKIITVFTSDLYDNTFLPLRLFKTHILPHCINF